MNNSFDAFAKDLAQCVSRRQALRRFGMGLAAMALGSLAPASKAAGNCMESGSPCGRPGQGGCGSCCSKTHFCEISEDTGKQCFCN